MGEKEVNEMLEKDKKIVEDFWNKLSLVEKMYTKSLYMLNRHKKRN